MKSTNTKISKRVFDEDLAPSWMKLNNEVREMVRQLKKQSIVSEASFDLNQMTDSTMKLCDHVEQMHVNMSTLLDKLDLHDAEALDVVSEKADKVDQAWARIQSENHELRADFKDIIKALFMWRDEPINRS